MQASWKERRVGGGVGEDIPQEKKSHCSDILPTWKGTLLSSPQSMMGIYERYNNSSYYNMGGDLK